MQIEDRSSIYEHPVKTKQVTMVNLLKTYSTDASKKEGIEIKLIWNLKAFNFKVPIRSGRKSNYKESLISNKWKNQQKADYIMECENGGLSISQFSMCIPYS